MLKLFFSSFRKVLLTFLVQEELRKWDMASATLPVNSLNEIPKDNMTGYCFSGFLRSRKALIHSKAGKYVYISLLAGYSYTFIHLIHPLMTETRTAHEPNQQRQYKGQGKGRSPG